MGYQLYSFEGEMAKEVGVYAAVILHNIAYWTHVNKANGRNFHNGRYWTYNSLAAMREMYPFMTTQNIRTAIGKLLEGDWICSGVFNDNAYDRTKWYSLSDKGLRHYSKVYDGLLKSNTSVCENDADGFVDSNTDICCQQHVSFVKNNKSNTNINHIYNTNIDKDIYIARETDIEDVALPLRDGTMYKVDTQYISQMQDAFPKVDIMQELRKMNAWLISNPEKQKTQRGIKRFINNWLSGVKETSQESTTPSGGDVIT